MEHVTSAAPLQGNIICAFFHNGDKKFIKVINQKYTLLERNIWNVLKEHVKFWNYSIFIHVSVTLYRHVLEWKQSDRFLTSAIM